MTDHLLRQELVGGYWFVRDEGRAVQLDDVGYQFLAVMVTARGHPADDDRGAPGPSCPGTEGARILAELQRCGVRFEGAEPWARVRHVPLPRGPSVLPTDAAIAPKRIYFEITRRCNLSCLSCFNNSHIPLSDELSLDEIMDVNRQAEELGVFEVRYTGGECTTVPGFADIVADARARGLGVSLGTNGVYTDEQLEWLPTCGVDWFIISLDGGRAINDGVRGRGTFDAVLRSLRVLSTYPRLRVRLNMVVAKHNVAEIENVARVAAEHNVRSLNLIPLRPYGRATRRLAAAMFRQADFYDFIREVNRIRRSVPGVTLSTTIDLLDPEATTSHDLVVEKTQTCAAGVEACVVGPQGHVYGCSYSPASFPQSSDERGRRTFVAGNVRENTLADIWRDSSRWAVFRDLATYKNAKCRSCTHYTVRCCGSCQIMAYHEMRLERADIRRRTELGDVCDPYCFVDLLDGQQGQDTPTTADATPSSGGAG